MQAVLGCKQDAMAGGLDDIYSSFPSAVRKEVSDVDNLFA